MLGLICLWIILIGLSMGAFIVREMTLKMVETGYWPERKPKLTAPTRPAPKLTARDAVVSRMGFSGRGLTIIRSQPTPVSYDVDEGCAYCTM